MRLRRQRQRWWHVFRAEILGQAVVTVDRASTQHPASVKRTDVLIWYEAAGHSVILGEATYLGSFDHWPSAEERAGLLTAALH